MRLGALTEQLLDRRQRTRPFVGQGTAEPRRRLVGARRANRLLGQCPEVLVSLGGNSLERGDRVVGGERVHGSTLTFGL